MTDNDSPIGASGDYAQLSEHAAALSGSGKKGGRRAAAKVQAAVDKTIDIVSERSEKAGATLRAASDRVNAVVDRVDPFVTERPYTTLAIGVAVGLLLGRLLAGGGPKVIYVKPSPYRSPSIRGGAH